MIEAQGRIVDMAELRSECRRLLRRLREFDSSGMQTPADGRLVLQILLDLSSLDPGSALEAASSVRLKFANEAYHARMGRRGNSMVEWTDLRDTASSLCADLVDLLAAMRLKSQARQVQELVSPAPDPESPWRCHAPGARE